MFNGSAGLRELKAHHSLPATSVPQPSRSPLPAAAGPALLKYSRTSRAAVPPEPARSRVPPSSQ